MANLGDFGTEPEPRDEDFFTYFGEQIRVSPTLTDADVIDFVELGGEVDEKDPQAAVLVKSFLRNVIHDEDFDRFWALGKAHRQNTEQRLEIAWGILEAQTDFPTQQPSDSSDGQPRTATRSPESSSSAVTLAERAQRRLEEQGRPDLAIVPMRYKEHLESRGA